MVNKVAIISFSAILILTGLYYTVYSDYLTGQALKTVFGDAYTSMPCWTYNYTEQQIVHTQNKLNIMIPENTNQLNKLEFIGNYLNGVNENRFVTIPKNYEDLIWPHFPAGVSLALTESMIFAVEDGYDGNAPKDCSVRDTFSFVNNGVLDSIQMSNWAVITTKIFNVAVARCKSMQNCSDFYRNISTLAEAKRSELQDYKIQETTICDSSYPYRYIKGVEKKERSALLKTQEPSSLLVRSFFIKSYSSCSDELYNKYIAPKGCDVIPNSRGQAISEALGAYAIFSNCMLNKSVQFSDELGYYYDIKRV